MSGALWFYPFTPVINIVWFGQWATRYLGLQRGPCVRPATPRTPHGGACSHMFRVPLRWVWNIENRTRQLRYTLGHILCSSLWSCHTNALILLCFHGVFTRKIVTSTILLLRSYYPRFCHVLPSAPSAPLIPERNFSSLFEISCAEFYPFMFANEFSNYYPLFYRVLPLLLYDFLVI